MTSTEPSTLPATLTDVREQLTRYVYCPLFVLGNIGNILNIMIFSQESLRTSICSIYFLIVSIANLVSINIGYLTRILPTLDVPDPSRNVAWYCKSRAYISLLSLTIGRHFLCLIAIDRFLVTSTKVNLRQLSSMKIAKWIIPISCMSWAIFYIHTIIGYENTRGGTSCGRQAGFYSTFTTICTIVLDAILPIIVMILFTLLMLRHIYGLRLRREKNTVPAQNVGPVKVSSINTIQTHTTSHHDNRSSTVNPNNIHKQREKQLTKLSLVQVLAYCAFNVPNAIYVVYMLIVTNEKKSTDRAAIESFVSSFAAILTYIYCTLTFYIYTLVLASYRAKTKQTLQRCLRILKIQGTRVSPFQN